jgi:hypothetical protein
MPGPGKKIDFSQLADWVEGRLAEEEARLVDAQVAVADSATLADIVWLQKFVKATEGAILEPPPAEVRNTLVARFEAYAEGRRAPGLLERIVATLTFDSSLRPAAGVRTASTQGARRQLIYSADALDLALNFWLRASDNDLDLEGQVFPRDDMELDSFIIQLLRLETEVAITATDEFGSFTFESITPGVYTVIACTDRVEVSITPVELYA